MLDEKAPRRWACAHACRRSRRRRRRHRHSTRVSAAWVAAAAAASAEELSAAENLVYFLVSAFDLSGERPPHSLRAPSTAAAGQPRCDAAEPANFASSSPAFPT